MWFNTVNMKKERCPRGELGGQHGPTQRAGADADLIEQRRKQPEEGA